MNMTGKEIITILQKEGREILRSQGSHYRLGKESLRVTIPVYGKKDLGKGFKAAIERPTGVKLS